MWYVYFLKLTNNKIYVGYSNDLRQRIQNHNEGKVPSTLAFLPVQLKSYIAVENRKKAIALEKYFKSASGKAFANKRFYDLLDSQEANKQTP